MEDVEEEYQNSFPLIGIGSLAAPGKAVVQCRQETGGEDDYAGQVIDAKIMAVKVANAH